MATSTFDDFRRPGPFSDDDQMGPDKAGLYAKDDKTPTYDPTLHWNSGDEARHPRPGPKDDPLGIYPLRVFGRGAGPLNIVKKEADAAKPAPVQSGPLEGYTWDAPAPELIGGKPVSYFTDNPKGEGLYRMLPQGQADASEKMIRVPFGRIQEAQAAGLRLHSDEEPRYGKDSRQGSYLGNAGAALLHDAGMRTPAEWYKDFREHPIREIADYIPLIGGPKMLAGMAKGVWEEAKRGGAEENEAVEALLTKGTPLTQKAQAYLYHKLSAQPFIGRSMQAALNEAVKGGASPVTLTEAIKDPKKYYTNLKKVVTNPKVVGVTADAAIQAGLTLDGYMALTDAIGNRLAVSGEYLPEQPPPPPPSGPPFARATTVRPPGLPPGGGEPPPPGGRPTRWALPAPTEGLPPEEQAVERTILGQLDEHPRTEEEVRRDLEEVPPERRQAVLEAIHQDGLAAYGRGDIAAATEAVRHAWVLKGIIEADERAARIAPPAAEEAPPEPAPPAAPVASSDPRLAPAPTPEAAPTTRPVATAEPAPVPEQGTLFGTPETPAPLVPKETPAPETAAEPEAPKTTKKKTSAADNQKAGELRDEILASGMERKAIMAELGLKKSQALTERLALRLAVQRMEREAAGKEVPSATEPEPVEATGTPEPEPTLETPSATKEKPGLVSTVADRIGAKGKGKGKPKGKAAEPVAAPVVTAPTPEPTSTPEPTPAPAEPVFETGKPVTFPFIHNTERAPNMGARFGQDVEPAGQYIQYDSRGASHPDERFAGGTITFRNPLVVPWGEGYQSPDSWKKVLSEKYGGKTGKALSDAIKADGYDGIVTMSKGHASEMVNLAGQKEQAAPETPAATEPEPPAETPVSNVAGANKILKAAGYPEKLVRGKGYYYFTGGDAASWPSSSIYWHSIAGMMPSQIIAAREALAPKPFPAGDLPQAEPEEPEVTPPVAEPTPTPAEAKPEPPTPAAAPTAGPVTTEFIKGSSPFEWRVPGTDYSIRLVNDKFDIYKAGEHVNVGAGADLNEAKAKIQAHMSGQPEAAAPETAAAPAPEAAAPVTPAPAKKKAVGVKAQEKSHAEARGRTREENAQQVTVKEGTWRHNAPMIAANDDAMVLLDRMTGLISDDPEVARAMKGGFSNGLTIKGSKADKIVADLRQLAEDDPEAHQGLTALADLMESHRTPNGNVVIHRDILSEAKINRLALEELFHDWQYRHVIAAKKILEMNGAMLLGPSGSAWRTVVDNLVKGGYKYNNATLEAPAWIAAGDYFDLLGIEDADEAKKVAVKLLADYFEAANRILKKDALEKLPPLAESLKGKVHDEIKGRGLGKPEEDVSGGDRGRVDPHQPAPSGLPEELPRGAAGAKGRERAAPETELAQSRQRERDLATDTPEFKRWFGDSRVVDKDGKPLVVYHGTHADIQVFKGKRSAHFGFHFGDQEAANTRLEDTAAGTRDRKEEKRLHALSQQKFDAWSRYDNELRAKNHPIPDDELLAALKADDEGNKGEVSRIFDKYAYKPTPDEAAKLAALRDAYDRSKQPVGGFGVWANIGKYYLRIRRPLKMHDVGDWRNVKEIKEHLPFDSDAGTLQELQDEIKGHGYDGIVYENRVENPVMRTESYIAFDPEQIKSATGNRGTYDPESPDILQSLQPTGPAPLETVQAEMEGHKPKDWLLDGVKKFIEDRGGHFDPKPPELETDSRAKEIADAYDAMKHEPDNPAVKASYDAFKRDIDEQWDYATKDMGVTFEPWNKPGQPYANSREMRADVRNNHHLYFFRGGEAPADHPAMEVDPATGLDYREKVRAVHDLFGHAVHGYQFGAKGEENAWAAHARMFSSEAIPALTANTKGQNSWVNFGPHMRRPDGTLIKEGEPGWIHPSKRPYAEQKAGVLPSRFNYRTDTPMSFISPNTYNLPGITEAQRQLKSQMHRRFVEQARQLAQDMGLKVNIEHSLGSWQGGAENSISVHYPAGTDPDLVNYYETNLGRLGYQNATGRFTPDADGKDTAHIFWVDSKKATTSELAKVLLSNGIENSTIVPAEGGYRVTVLDGDNALHANIDRVADELGVVHVEQHAGKAEFPGDYESRDSAERNFRSTLEAIESARGRENLREIRKGFESRPDFNFLHSAIRSAHQRAEALVRAYPRRADGTDVSGRSAEKPYTYQRRVHGAGGVSRVVGAKVHETWTLDPAKAEELKGQGYNSPDFHQLSPDDHQSADAFHASISALKKDNPFHASVHVYPKEDYAGMRLFLTDDGKAGFAIKPNGDMVSGFTKGASVKGAVHTLLEIGKQAGGTKNDCFDTVLPEIYSLHGFKVVARLPWNDEFSPEGWDKATYARYNNGEPDVVFMVHDPAAEPYRPWDGETVSDYDEGVRLQDEALRDIANKTAEPDEDTGVMQSRQRPEFTSPGFGNGNPRKNKRGRTAEEVVDFAHQNEAATRYPKGTKGADPDGRGTSQTLWNNLSTYADEEGFEPEELQHEFRRQGLYHPNAKPFKSKKLREPEEDIDTLPSRQREDAPEPDWSDPPRAGESVAGLTVSDNIPNRSSIYSSLSNPTVLPGVRELPLDEAWNASPEKMFYNVNDIKRVHRLAEGIKNSGVIEPLIVGVESGEPHIIEGVHRLSALHVLGKKSFPAIVAVEEDDLDTLQSRQRKTGPGTIEEVRDEAKRLPGIGDYMPDTTVELGAAPDEEQKNNLTWDDVKDVLIPEERVRYEHAPEERRKYLAMVNMMPNRAEWDAAAKVGRVGALWYERSSRAFDALIASSPEYFKRGDKEKFLNFVSALSPVQTVRLNLGMAINLWAKWHKAGRPMDVQWQKPKTFEKVANEDAKLYRIMAGLDEEEAPKGALWQEQPAKPGAEKKKKKGGVVLKSRLFNAIRALQGQPLSGPKVGAFAPNLGENVDKSTNDTWMAIFSGVDPNVINQQHIYDAVTTHVRLAARENDLNTRQSQAAIWSFIKTLAEASGWGPGRWIPPQQVIDENLLSPELIALRSQDFADLLRDDYTIRALLSRIGVDLNALDRNLKRKVPARPTVGQGAAKELAGQLSGAAGRLTAARSDPRIEERLAQKLDTKQRRFQAPDESVDNPSPLRKKIALAQAQREAAKLKENLDILQSRVNSMLSRAAPE
jgi:hypothetical protein